MAHAAAKLVRLAVHQPLEARRGVSRPRAWVHHAAASVAAKDTVRTMYESQSRRRIGPILRATGVAPPGAPAFPAAGNCSREILVKRGAPPQLRLAIPDSRAKPVSRLPVFATYPVYL